MTGGILLPVVHSRNEGQKTIRTKRGQETVAFVQDVSDVSAGRDGTNCDSAAPRAAKHFGCLSSICNLLPTPEKRMPDCRPEKRDLLLKRTGNLIIPTRPLPLPAFVCVYQFDEHT